MSQKGQSYNQAKKGKRRDYEGSNKNRKLRVSWSLLKWIRDAKLRRRAKYLKRKSTIN